MTRIAYIVSTLKRCGPNNQLRSIIRHLDRTRFEPLVITLSPEPVDSVKALFEQDGIPVCSLDFSRVTGLLFARRKLKRLLRTKQVDLLHTQGIRTDSLAASLRTEWPSVCSVRNFPQLDYPMTYGVFRGRMMARSHARVLGQVAAPVGVSGSVARNLRDLFGVDARTVCNGVETADWIPASPEERVALRQKLKISETVRLWVSVGHLSERKDPLALIRAFRKAGMENAQFVFLGSGPLEAECRRAADGCEQIVFAGRVENVSDWLRAADAFVSASHAEGFPNAVLEALACGLPCLLSGILPHLELIEQAGNCIKLFPTEHDVSERARQMERFEITQPLRTAARTAAETKLSAETTSGRYQEIYRELSR